MILNLTTEETSYFVKKLDDDAERTLFVIHNQDHFDNAKILEFEKHLRFLSTLALKIHAAMIDPFSPEMSEFSDGEPGLDDHSTHP